MKPTIVVSEHRPISSSNREVPGFSGRFQTAQARASGSNLPAPGGREEWNCAADDRRLGHVAPKL